MLEWHRVCGAHVGGRNAIRLSLVLSWSDLRLFRGPPPLTDAGSSLRSGSEWRRCNTTPPFYFGPPPANGSEENSAVREPVNLLSDNFVGATGCFELAEELLPGVSRRLDLTGLGVRHPHEIQSIGIS